MTNQELREKLFQRVTWSPAPNAQAQLPGEFYESLIDILVEQRRVIEFLLVHQYPLFLDEKMRKKFLAEVETISAATDARLKAMGVER